MTSTRRMHCEQFKKADTIHFKHTMIHF